MAGVTRITQLPVLASVSQGDVLPIVSWQSGAATTYRVAVSVLFASNVHLATFLEPTTAYADDAAAAAAGVPVNGLYLKTGGTVAWRVS
jgi:hypothetical protein